MDPQQELIERLATAEQERDEWKRLYLELQFRYLALEHFGSDRC